MAGNRIAGVEVLQIGFRINGNRIVEVVYLDKLGIGAGLYVKAAVVGIPVIPTAQAHVQAVQHTGGGGVGDADLTHYSEGGGIGFTLRLGPAAVLIHQGHSLSLTDRVQGVLGGTMVAGATIAVHIHVGQDGDVAGVKAQGGIVDDIPNGKAGQSVGAIRQVISPGLMAYILVDTVNIHRERGQDLGNVLVLQRRRSLTFGHDGDGVLGRLPGGTVPCYSKCIYPVGKSVIGVRAVGGVVLVVYRDVVVRIANGNGKCIGIVRAPLYNTGVVAGGALN